jgi:hypothetical protein
LPEFFQGSGKRRHYFEGWYFKHSGGPDRGAWSFIPGVAFGDSRKSAYSFVQAIEGETGRSWWFQYPLESFSASASSLDIRVGGNSFSAGGIELDLNDGTSTIRGHFSYGPFAKLSFPFWSPGVMGPYSFVPGMECNHGLVSLDHSVDGSIEVDGREIVIDDGRGYIEKDWGRSMPESWVWMQSNDFPARGDSLMLSVAKIPWAGSAFRGFLCVLSLGKEKQLFASYNGSKISSLVVTDTLVECRISKSARGGVEESLKVTATRSRGGILLAPVSGILSRRIAEAVDASIEVEYFRPGRGTYFNRASPAGLEVVGDISAMDGKASR